MAELHIIRTRYSKEQEELIRNNYPNLDLLEELIPGKNRKAIIQKAGKMGISKPNNEKFTDKEDNIIKKYYPSNGSDYICKNFLINRGISEIQQRAFKLGVKYLQYNEDYFEDIDSGEKAYWLGFIYTDGYITEKTNRFGIELGIEDYNHLQNFLDLIESNMKIRTRIRENKFESKNKEALESCSILFNNKKMYEDLINKGVVPSKSLTIDFPKEDIVKDKYIFDFIRGIIDGDGSIGLYNTSNGYKKPHISLISGSYDFMLGLKNKLSEFGINLNISNRGNLYRLMSEKQDEVFKLLKLIYKNSTEKSRLERKYIKNIDICNYYNIKIL